MSNYLDYPNPVLSADRDDYTEGCSFDVFFDEALISVDDEYINIPVKYDLKSDGLAELVKSQKACVVVLIYSSGTMFRSAYIFETDKQEMLIKIPKFNVKDDMEFSSFILANENINNFSVSCDKEISVICNKFIGFISFRNASENEADFILQLIETEENILGATLQDRATKKNLWQDSVKVNKN